MEFSGGMDSEASISMDEQKPEDSPPEVKKSYSLDIQTRPLPPIPLDAPAEPDYEAPEPAYESIDNDHEPSYEVVHHQRSVSDHVLSIRKNSDEDKIRKSNSDSGERHVVRSGSTVADKKQEEAILPEKKISCASKMSNSTPSIGPKEDTKDVRARSITTDSTTVEDEKVKSRPQLAKSPNIENIRNRSHFNSVSEQRQRLVLFFVFPMF